MSRHPQHPNAQRPNAQHRNARDPGAQDPSTRHPTVRRPGAAAPNAQDRQGQDPAVTGWSHGDRVVRWTHGGGIVQKDFAGPTQAALAWNGRVLVVEALDDTPYTPTDNAVVYEADGTELVRLAPPRDLVAEPSWVFGFFTAHLDAEGRPVLVVATQVGDFWGHPDLASGTVVDVQEWR
ncbi:hypothetical protein QRN89_12270 [Streptomyces chengbuensis]|uniref:hypothetical protein n=1 Tax=Streptomyces TaxID=1883 RepID=UPI0025B43386|nr:hypothetical protein [Streptomyces sp. HUAS CB01]WJY50521.1 hypothetical protein QRN89_12270 [Streptomyces sp. HUAS CB01]